MSVVSFFRVRHNGSADLRSPEKEVCFRSWDFANSQMCEVRVATSNICGCNPPNRCGERSGADFATSVLGFAKAGQSKPKCLANIQNFNRSTNVEFCTSAPLLQNRCYRQYFFKVQSSFLYLLALKTFHRATQQLEFLDIR